MSTPDPLVRIGSRRVRLTNLDKVLYPAADFTKGQVLDYYRRVAPAILPHLRGRPLTLKRYPDGVDAPSFYEKRCPSHKPDWVRTARLWSDRNDDWVDYCLVPDLAALLWVANLAAIELHVLLGRAAAPGRPTSMVFDLDPGPPAGLRDCARVALRLRDLLASLGLRCLAKTSGGNGLHVYVPLNTRTTFERTKAVSRALASLLERDDPRRVTTNMRRDLRPGRVFIDWGQNDAHKTTACAYTLRARPWPTVSCPVAWDEVEPAARRRRDADRLSFDAPAVVDRVERLGDLFASVLDVRQALPGV